MNEAQVRILEQVSEVLAGTQELQLGPVADETGSYASIEQALKRFDYRCLNRMELSAVLIVSYGHQSLQPHPGQAAGMTLVGRQTRLNVSPNGRRQRRHRI